MKKDPPADATSAAGAGSGRRGEGRAAAGKPLLHPGEDGSDDEEEFGPRPFVPPPRPFAMDSPAYQARAWDMWEPGGGRGPGAAPGGYGVGRRVGKDAGNSYVVLFDYGSVVFMHFTQQQQEVRFSIPLAYESTREGRGRGRGG